MLTKLILAGLIPGVVVAKPISMASSSSAKVAFSTATPDKGAHAHPKAIADENKRRLPVQDASYPVAVLPPAVSPSVLSATVPSILPSLAVSDIPVLPALSVAASYPVALPPVSASAIQTFPVQVPYAVKTPVVQPVLPISTPSVVPSSLVQLPYSIKTPPVQPVLPISTPTILPSLAVYSVNTPVVQIPISTPTILPSPAVYSINTPVIQLPISTPTILPSPAVYGVNTPIVQVPVPTYPVAPVSTPSSAPLVQIPQSIKTPPVQPAIPVATYAAGPPAALPYDVKSAVPTAPYVVGSSALPAVSGVSAVSAVSAAATQALSYPSVAAYPEDHLVAPSYKDLCARDCIAKCENVERVADIASCRASCLSSCANALHPVPIVDNSKDKNADKSPAKSAAVPGHGVSAPAINAGGLTWEACMESCSGRVQHADIASDITQGRGSCTEACAGYAKSGAGVNIKRNIKDIIPPTPKLGAGEHSYEACLKSCHAKFQHAGIASDISTGKGDCAEACAAGYGYGAGVITKRNVKDIMPTGPSIGAGGYAYEACMKSCSAKWQHAGIASNIFQGKGGCAEACAAQAAYGASVNIKKRTVKDIVPAGPKIGAGAMTYEGCMKDCHWKDQTAHIAFDVSQGKWSCKQACARYASNGAGVVIKKDAPAEE
ncbi:hypothetical protein F5Y12DRAFT_792619 [Xylaria sp. FL1777]|nr:hypothetical protein F5Y12DRAFT_792619 [Xylaria sp. FL1777]